MGGIFVGCREDFRVAILGRAVEGISRVSICGRPFEGRREDICIPILKLALRPHMRYLLRFGSRERSGALYSDCLCMDSEISPACA